MLAWFQTIHAHISGLFSSLCGSGVMLIDLHRLEKKLTDKCTVIKNGDGIKNVCLLPS